jgi:hypothetical protein
MKNKLIAIALFSVQLAVTKAKMKLKPNKAQPKLLQLKEQSGRKKKLTPGTQNSHGLLEPISQLVMPLTN